MATFLRSIVVETLEAPLPPGTQIRSIVIETLEAPLPPGTQLRSLVVEVLEVARVAGLDRNFNPQENLKYHKNIQGSRLKNRRGQI